MGKVASIFDKSRYNEGQETTGRESEQISDQTREGFAMRIRGIENLSPAELEQEVAAGGRFVFFECCISLLVVTLRRPSDLWFLRAGDHGLLRGLPYTLVSLLLGWWGIPWGIIYTPLTVLTNLAGGCDVTEQVLPLLRRASAESSEAGRTQPCAEV